MTTPNSNTLNAVVVDALRDAGKLPLGVDPSGEQLVEAMRRLNDQINYLQTKGLKLWKNNDITVPIVSGQASYTFGPGLNIDMTKPLRVLEAYYLYTSTNTRRPLTVMALKDYWLLGQAGTLATNQGTMSQYVVDKFDTYLKVTFWLCPNDEEADNGEVHLLMQTQITNPTELDETINFPIEWRNVLRWCLAADLATGQPEAIVQRCEKWAQFYREEMEGWDVEDAPTLFAVDQRVGMYSTGGFR